MVAFHYTVFRVTHPTKNTRGFAGSICPVKGHNDKPLRFLTLRSAEEAAKRLSSGNCRLGSDYATNVTYTHGWVGLHP